MRTINPTTFFCRNQVHPADDCRCPKAEPLPSFWTWDNVTAKDVWALAIAVLVLCVLLGSL